MSLKPEHTREEILIWLQMLDYQQQEIIDMKTRIAEVIKGSVSKEILEQLEEFQNVFLSKETVIAFCKRDILQLMEDLDSGRLSPESLKIMQEDIPKLQQEFNSLRKKFNNGIN